MIKNFAAFICEALTCVNTWTHTQISSGGCGVFAAILSDKLTELGIKHKISVLYWNNKEGQTEGRDNFKEFIKTHDKKNLKKAGEDHVVIYIEDEELYVDPEGIINPFVLRVDERIEIDRETLQELVDNGDWNPVFDRDCIPEMKERMDYVFSKMNNFETGCFDIPKEGQIKFSKKTMREKRKQGSLIDALLGDPF